MSRSSGGFKPGYDPRRNSTGKNRKHPLISDMLYRIGNERLPKELKGKLPEHIQACKTLREALMRVTYLRAIQGESWAVQFVAERTEGKVKDRLEVEGGQRLEIVEEIVDSPHPPAP